MEVRSALPTCATQVVSPFRLRPEERPAAAGDRVDLQAAPPSVPTSTASAPHPMSLKARMCVIGALGLAVAAAAGGVAWGTHHAVPPPPATSTVQVIKIPQATDQDKQVLFALDKGGQLTDGGRPTDAYGAMQALDAGRPIGVGVPRLGYHASATVDDSTGALKQDDAKAAQDKLPISNDVVTVGNVTQLERLNAAEKLTPVDTSASLSAAEQTLVAQLTPFEGGVPTTHIAPGEATQGVRFLYGSDMPTPALLKANHSSSFKPGDRLTAFEALGRISSGQPVVVRSADGLEQTIRGTADVPALNRVELPLANPLDPKTAKDSDLQEEILRELSSQHMLISPSKDAPIWKGETITGFQAEGLLNAGKPVAINIGNGVKGTVTSLKDLELLNGEEGFTRVDTSSLLSARDLQTAQELRTYEGRTADQQQAGLFGTRPAWFSHKTVASSDRLDVRDARNLLSSGKPIAVRTQRGQVHIIHNVAELDVLAALVPPPPPPPPPAPPAAPPSTDSSTATTTPTTGQ